MLDNLREQFREQLAETGFVAAAVPSHRASGRDATAGLSAGMAVDRGQDEGPGLRDPDRNASNIALVQSALCAGLYPNVAAFVRPDPQRQVRMRVHQAAPLPCVSSTVVDNQEPQ